MKALAFLKAPPDVADVRVALISGAEELLRARVARKLLERLGDAAQKDVIEGPSARELSRFDLRGFLDTLRTPSLFGGETTVVLTNADAVVKEHGDALIRFLKEEDPCHRLILEGDALAARPGGKSSAKKDALADVVLARGGIVVLCDPLYDTPYQGRGAPWQTELVRFMVEEARARGKDLAAEDAYEMHQLVGSGLRELVAEIDKLVTYVGPRRRIEGSDIEAAVGAVRTSPTFRLAEAVASCNLKESLRVSSELFERGAADASSSRRVTDEGSITMMLIGAIAAKLRRVGAVLDLVACGASLDEAMASVPTHPAFRHQLEEQVVAWKDRSLWRATAALVELEHDLKTAGGPPRELVDRFLVTALREAGAPRKRKGA